MNTPGEVNFAARQKLVGADEFVVLVKTSDGIMVLSSVYSDSTLDFSRVLGGTIADLIGQATGSPDAETLFKSVLYGRKPRG